MIHMSAYIPKNADEKLRSLLHWGKLRQEQLSEAFLITKDTVLGFLKRQIEHGNWSGVLEVLKGKPMTQAGRYMLGELRSKVVRKLIMRMGLRPVIATALVIVLLPIILAKVTGEVIGWIRNRR
ncbi:hypothetical protein [Pontibacter lucknowensis]|uniref:Uncharacterized protein n=1 Tax=Pontibacter lucknowensis TaxID=1077936 RepID=A0A1N6X3N7_9BACT|nr:hypothetical protein [Pontibacter lucknowensis]SIQ96871.1 hypothetical protein SAMN05421545_1905 [Pontibacter lucknowensis]